MNHTDPNMLWYAQLGFQVFPCKAQAKTPLTEHGFHDASDEEGQIQDWILKHPNCNWSVATGAVSDVFVLDVDKDKGGFESLDRLEKKHGRLPDSWTARTGGGGVHIYFKHPGYDIRTRAGKLGPGLDIRGDGGYAVLPPSLHDSGQRYEWKTPPGECPLADAPDWLLELIRTKPQQKNKSAGIKEHKNLIPHGERHDRLVQEAGKLRRLEYESEEMFDILWLFFQKRCEKLDTDDEEALQERIRKIADSGCALWTKGTGEYKLSDQGNAERFQDMFQGKARFCVSWNKWLLWDGKCWRKDDLLKIQSFAIESTAQIWEEAKQIKGDPETTAPKREAYAKWYKTSQKAERINAIIRLAKGMLAISVDDLDKDPWKLNVLNGTVNLQTGELEKHDREELITKLAPVKYNKNAKSPTFNRFIKDVMMGDQDLLEFVQRFFGYALTADIRERVFVVFHGIGKNGKSTLLESVKAMMGDYAMDTPAETLLKKPEGAIPNDIARLKGVRFVSASEAEENKTLSASVVKKLTGKDTIPARFMRAEFFDFKPCFKLCLHTNHLPRVSADDQAVWDRIRLVPFNMRVGENIEEDKDLDKKMLGELDGILMWCIQGCLMWQREGLQAPSKVTAATDKYREEEDLLTSFMEDYCHVDGEEESKAGDVYEVYKAWCLKNGHRSLGSQNLKKRLGKKGFTQTRNREGRFYKGFSLTEEAVAEIRAGY